jgi:activator of 2-hydroxyglutaryl-CoA dehydratase
MRGQIIQEQKIARLVKEKEDAIKAAKRKRIMETLTLEISLVVGIIMFFVVIGALFTWIHYDKKKRWPELEQRTYQQELEREKQLRTERILQAIKYLDEKNQEENKKLITPDEKK